jgi:hypothetical protein
LLDLRADAGAADGVAGLRAVRLCARNTRCDPFADDLALDSANTPIIWNSALPPGVVVLIPCW